MNSNVFEMLQKRPRCPFLNKDKVSGDGCRYPTHHQDTTTLYLFYMPFMFKTLNSNLLSKLLKKDTWYPGPYDGDTSL